MDDVSCPDCSAVMDADLKMFHDDGCPVAAETEAMTEADRLWFEQHPDAERYFRKARPGDFGVRTFASMVEPDGKVEVVQLEPGIRTRRLPTLILIADHNGEVISQDGKFLIGMYQHMAEAPDWLAEKGN